MAAPSLRSPVELIESAFELPAVPTVAAQVVQHLGNPDSSAESIGKIIANDQAMTARILQVANSSVFGGRAEVILLKHAIVRMGLSTLRGIVMSLSTKSLFRKFGPLERALWQHAVSTAIGAHLIALEVGSRFCDQAFVAGLMHDVGKVLLMEHDRSAMESIILAHKDDERSFESEQRVFGFTHMDVGALLVRKWDLPAAIGHAAFLHHDLNLAALAAEDMVQLVYIVSLADRLTHFNLRHPAATDGSPEMDDDREHEAAEELGLSGSRLGDLQRLLRQACDAQLAGLL